jgi:CheY-like chemotaxis protein
MQTASIGVPRNRVTSLSKLRVLVVDDYPETSEVICALFQTLGHETRAAGTGRHALAEALAFDPHLALLDIRLPDLSGFELARALRAQPGGHRRHLVALTGWASNDCRRRALEAGCNDFVVKPATATRLRALVATLQRG